jgi:hypothetical protein
MQGLARAQSQSAANPSLARNAYSSSVGDLYLVPGADSLCVVAVDRTLSGGTLVSCARTTEVTDDGLGLILSGEQGFTLAGVLPHGAHNALVVDASGENTAIPLSSDDGYWVTMQQPPSELRWTDQSGSSHTKRRVAPPG